MTSEETGAPKKSFGAFTEVGAIKHKLILIYSENTTFSLQLLKLWRMQLINFSYLARMSASIYATWY